MTDYPAANEILTRASRLTADELITLGEASRPLASGLLRPKHAWASALRSASAAAEAAGTSILVEALQSAALVAVISSVLTTAEARGKDAGAARAAFEDWRREVDRRSPRSHRAFRKLQRTLLRATDLTVHRRLKDAVFATAGAVTAIVTWDLVDPDGDYTPSLRALLVAPWRQALGLPTGLGDQ